MGQGVLNQAPREIPRSRQAAGAALIVLLFCAGLVPLAHDYYFVHVDEHLYADAAIGMVRSGDWATAYDNTGYPRFQKPILTYWLVAASFRLFGISPLTSRLPSLLAAAATLLITAALALRVTRRADAAILAMLILGSTPPFILAAIRANPDIFLTMFIAWSAYGFAGLMFYEPPRPRSGWYAYVGAGLAIMAKGLPALMFVAYAWLFAWLSNGGTKRWQRAFPILPLIAGLGIPAVWFFATLHAHGALFAHVMWNDQVRARVSVGLLVTPLRVFAMLAQYLLFFLPWSVVIAMKWLTSRSLADSADENPFSFFAIGFSLLYAVVFGLNPTMNGHYLLPACPLIAIVIAGALGGALPAPSRIALNWTTAIVTSALLVVSIVAIAEPGRGFATIVVSLACATFAGSMLFAIRGLAEGQVLTRLAIALYLFFPLASVMLRPWLLPDFGRQVLAALPADPMTNRRQIVFVGTDRLASYVRVEAGGKLEVVDAIDVAHATRGDPEIIVAPSDDAPDLESQGYSIRPAGEVILRIPASEIVGAVLRMDLGTFLASAKEKFVVGVRSRQTPN